MESARKMLSLLCILVVCTASCLAQTVPMRWCTVSQEEMNKCNDLKAATTDINPSFSCVQASNRYECMRRIRENLADVVRLDDTDIYAGGKVFGLKPLVKETFSTEPNADAFLYKAVVVVRANGGIVSPDGLSQRKSCHTGVGRTVGWTVPVSNLIALQTMPVESCDNTVKTVARFFSQSCAPGAFDLFNNPGSDNPTNVCALCGNSTCPGSDQYAGYEGAMQCLLDGRGDVAFVKHSTIDDMIRKGKTINKEDFRLLCPNGKTAADLKLVDNWNACNWAERPTDVIATNPSKPVSVLSDMRAFLQTIARQFSQPSAAFKLFESSTYGASQKDLMVSDGAKGLLAVDTAHADYSTYFTPGYFNTMEHYITCGSSLKWCVNSDAEQGKCEELSAALAASRITNKMTCVRAANHAVCMEKINKGEADLVTVDGGDVYTGGKYQNLVPIAAENYDGEEATSYYAVAVVKKSNAGVNINNLRGKKSCHTGIHKTAGWNIPVGTLVRKELVKDNSGTCDLDKAVGNFFSSSCVPGALSERYNPKGDNPASMCSLCGGAQFCERASSNKYYDYKGAFRCLVERDADVAFIKHSTVLDYTDGKLQESWAASLRSADFELLCLDGTRRPVTDYKDCSLAKVPSHAVVTSKSKSVEVRTQYQTILSRAQIEFGRDSTDYNMFEGLDGVEAIFSSKTRSLTNLKPEDQDHSAWLDHSYLAVLDAIDPHKCNGVKSMHAFSVLLALLVLLVHYVLAV